MRGITPVLRRRDIALIWPHPRTIITLSAGGRDQDEHMFLMNHGGRTPCRAGPRCMPLRFLADANQVPPDFRDA